MKTSDENDPPVALNARSRDVTYDNAQGALAPGAIVDVRYEIIRVAGNGSYTDVYLAIDQHLRRRVALKVTRVSAPGSSSRFRREVALGAQLQHPNIVGLLGYGEVSPGVPYLALEWIEGETLATRLARVGRLSWTEAVALGAQLAGALRAAHELNVLHRDIKPNNVLIDMSKSAEGVPRLADFGALGELITDDHDQRVTQSGYFIGTPAYMSPEQLTGKQHSVATDIYGLGILLYETLFGLSHIGVTPSDIFVRRLSQDLEIPDDASVPKALRELLARMLRREPSERPRSAEQVRDELVRLQALGSPFASEAVACVTRPLPMSAAVPPAIATASPRSVWMVGGALVAGAFAAGAVLISWPSGGSGGTIPARLRRGLPGIGIGLLLIVLGVVLGAAVTRALLRRKSALESEAGNLLLGTKSRQALTRTLVVEIEVLIERVKSIDARVLGITVVQMLREYESAKASPDRVTALMNASQLIERFMKHLSPWYVRHAQLIGFVVTVVGAVGGVAKIILDVMKIAKGG